MRVDAANARLRIIAPIVRDHGIDYERGKFQVIFTRRETRRVKFDSGFT